ncbi:MAG: T9SS type A sorting domain-containing protein [Bacteroidales bacterium]|jgi:hypothetical protein|nr:T9SS type A sorting domain-containing protein [Bacteroidales bacterium]
MKKQLFFLVLLLCLAGITVHAQQRKVLFEEFTSSTCYPYCPQYNVLINPWLAANAEKVVAVKYQMNWPGAGDPYYTPEGGTRRAYYGVNGVPDAFVNGVNPGGSTIQQMFNNTVNLINNGYAQPAQADITGTFKITGNTITIAGSVTPLISGSGYKIHVIVNEKTTHNNKMTNGETEFYHVMMKMFPNGSGTDVTLTEGTAIPFNYTYDMSTTHVEEMDDLEVAVFVQNTSTRAVLNAAYMKSIPPAPPTNLEAVQEGADVVLTWVASIEEVDGYNVYLDGTLYQDNVTETTYTLVKVPVGEHVFGVTSVTDDSESEMITVTLEVIADGCSQPKSLDAVQEGADVVLTWVAPVEEVDSYNVYLDGTLYKDNITETTYTLVKVPAGEHVFGVTAVTGDCESEMITKTLEVVADDCPQPTDLEAVQQGTDVVLTWVAPDADVDSYKLYFDGMLHGYNITQTTYAFNDIPVGTYTFGVSAVIGECESEISEIEFTTTITGISELQNAFTLYPNPVSSTLNINTKGIITDCQIFNIQGQLIYSIQSDVKEIATDGWASGIYIIRITTEKGSAEKRFIKN